MFVFGLLTIFNINMTQVIISTLVGKEINVI